VDQTLDVMLDRGEIDACTAIRPDARVTLDQLRFAHANGAVAVFMRGIENEHLLHDPCFFPLYEAVSALHMAIGVHAGNGNPYVRELLAQRNAPGTFWAYRMSSIGAFHSLVMAGLPDRFPHLRMVFVEIASQWVPWTLKDLARRLPQQRGRALPENPLRAYRLYVACQSDDDLPYVLTYTGEDNMMMGTDYGHHDHAADLEGLRNLKTAGGISARVYDKIVDANPRAAYGL